MHRIGSVASVRVRTPRSPLRATRVRRFAELLVAALIACSAMPVGVSAHTEGLAEEPVLPGLDVAVDFQVAPSGDVYVAHQDGRIVRYHRAAGSTSASPSYDLSG